MADTSKELLAGATAGFAATVPMTAVMALFYRTLPPGEEWPPPWAITMHTLEAAGVEPGELSEPEKVGATAVAHFG